MIRLRLIPVVLLVTSSAACGRAADAVSGAFAVRDSAGIQIAESSGPAWGEGEGWRLSATPVLQIGEAEGAAEYMLNSVRSVVRLGSGNIVAAMGSTEFRIYDPAGRHLRTVGRRGGGPGEFQLLARLFLLPGDSIVAYDLMARRLSFYDPGGNFLRATTLDSSSGVAAQVLDILPDHSLIGTIAPIDRNLPTEGLVRTPEIFVRLDSAGVLLDTITVQPGSERFIRTEGSDGRITTMSMTTPIFGRAQVAVAGGGSLFVGSNDAWQIEEFASDGRQVRTIRRLVDPQPVTRELADSAAAARLESVTSETARRNIRIDMEAMPLPETMPHYLALRRDEAGNLWVQDFAPVREAALRWSVFDPDGQFLGTVRVPERFRLERVGEDFVLGVGRDELDVEQIQMYALEKP